VERSDGPRSERERIRSALVELVAAQGFAATSAEQVAQQAGVDPGGVERHFGSLEACFATVWDKVDAELSGRMAAAFGREGEWRERLRHALLAALRYLAAEPGPALLYISEALYVDERLRARRQTAVARLSSMIDLGQAAQPDSEPPPPRISEAISGAIWHRVNVLLRAGQAAELPGELPLFMYFAVLPYYGTSVAEGELRRPAT
jgi:AcrR family transcriptional regulator